MNQSQPNKRVGFEQQNDESARSLSIEEVLGTMLEGQIVTETKWVEKDLPKLVDEIKQNYDNYKDTTHLEGKDLPSKQVVIAALEDLLSILLPGYLGKTEIDKSNVELFLYDALISIHDRLVDEVEKSLKWICRRIKECPEDLCLNKAQEIIKEILAKIPEIRTLLREDIQAAYDGDPAAKSIDEVILSYPCVLAIATYRIAHELYARGVPLVPRIMTEHAHSITGIDIHPGARIGKSFFIDHGTGVVVGETAEIGDNVKVYQGVTLGALSFPKDEMGRIMKGVKRHPTIGNNVIIYSGATILGGKTMIGDNAVVGGNVWITSPIPADTQVILVPPELIYKDVNGKTSYNWEDYVI